MNPIQPLPRHESYAACGYALGEIGLAVGIPLKDNEVTTWADCMTRLADADNLSETPMVTLSGARLLEILGVRSEHPQLLHSADRLLDASQHSYSAKTCGAHIASRIQEARLSFDLLRYQTTSSERRLQLWSELYKLCSVGVLLDTIDDRFDDAEKLPFTPRKIAACAFGQVLKISASVRPKTYRAVLNTGLKDIHVAYALAKPLRMCAKKIRNEHSI